MRFYYNTRKQRKTHIYVLLVIKEVTKVQIIDYIVKEMYILIPVLYIIGTLLKRSPKLPNWLIPWILLILGIVGCCLLDGMSIQNVIQGILVAGVSVLANQLFKQTKEMICSRRNK